MIIPTAATMTPAEAEAWWLEWRRRVRRLQRRGRDPDDMRPDWMLNEAESVRLNSDSGETYEDEAGR